MSLRDLFAAEDKREARYGWVPGDYLCKCRICEKEFLGAKHAWNCAPCAYDRPTPGPTDPTINFDIETG